MQTNQPRLGARRARQLFLVALAVQIVLFLVELRHLPPADRWVVLAVGFEWVYGGLFTLAMILVGAGVIHSRLDQEQRKPFWISSIAYLFVFVLLWLGAGLGLLDMAK